MASEVKVLDREGQCRKMFSGSAAARPHAAAQRTPAARPQRSTQARDGAASLRASEQETKTAWERTPTLWFLTT